jgi:hypothetical protein
MLRAHHYGGILGDPTVTRLHARFAQVEAAYMQALAGRDPASVNVRTLLPKIFELVPDTSVEEILAMLRWSARKDFREAGKLDAWWTRKRNLDDPGAAR